MCDDEPVEIDSSASPEPHGTGLRMQYQETRQWCWIAIGTSVDRFYNPASRSTQCKIVTAIGHDIYRYPADTTACPSEAAVASVPGLAAILANPYQVTARYALDNPSLGINRLYIKPGSVSDALRVRGHWAGARDSALPLGDINREIHSGRPVVATIKWPYGTEHFVAIAGVAGDTLLILDPENGQSIVPFGSFPGSYVGGASLIEYHLTKP